MLRASRGVQPLLRNASRRSNTLFKKPFSQQTFVKNELSPVAMVAIGAGVLAAGYGIYKNMGSSDDSYPPNGLSPVVKDCPTWIKTGCGNDEYMFEGKYKGDEILHATFPYDKCPDQMPDLSNYTNLMAEVLRENPDIYQRLKDKKTKNGVTLAKCIKTGMDNPSHPYIKTCGFVGGDEESWEVFGELADKIVSKRHGGYPAGAKHPSDLDWNKLSKTRIDPTCDANGKCKYVLTSRIRTGRSVRGIRLPPSIGFEERRELERVVTSGLCNLGIYDSPEGKIDLQGEYFPLNGSKSYAAKPGGMSHEKETFLRGKGNLFQEPDSPLLLSSGMGRHWPDARGIFHNKEQNFFVWINEEDHMRIISMEPGDGIKKIFVRFATACNEVQKSLKNEGYDFMHSDHLGWILTCPSNLGTGLRAGAMIGLPLLSKRPDFKAIAVKMRLQVRGRRGVDSASEGGVFDISNADRIGKSEVQLVNTFIEGAAKMIQWEQLLEQGKSIDHLLPK